LLCTPFYIKQVIIILAHIMPHQYLYYRVDFKICQGFNTKTFSGSSLPLTNISFLNVVSILHLAAVVSPINKPTPTSLVELSNLAATLTASPMAV